VTLPDGANDVRLRLRVPATHVLTSVEVGGERWDDHDAATGDVALRGRAGRVDVVACYRRAG
jgi:hypothetical protein